VTTAVWAALMVPAVAVKLADVAPDATVTEEGTDNVAVLLESASAMPAEPAACESVTVQDEVPPEPRLVGLHVSWLTAAGGTSSRENVCELPL